MQSFFQLMINYAEIKKSIFFFDLFKILKNEHQNFKKTKIIPRAFYPKKLDFILLYRSGKTLIKIIL